MNTSNNFSTRLPILALVVALLVAGCGGSNSQQSETPTIETTGTVALLFTDKPTDEFSAIKLNVVEATLIGGEGQQTLFQGVKSIDLLNLTNYNEPVVFGQVEVGIYTKLRLVIDELELVPNDGGPSIFPALPANGKIDLLEPQGFAVLPGRTLMAEIDMDANKSIKITGDAPKASGDPARVRQIIRNLLSNAARYGGDQISIELGGNPLFTSLRVTDNGEPIPMKDRQRIFDSYERAHHVRGAPDSVGLGLSISRHLARLMGGHLTYDHRNGYSVFELTLPTAANTDAPSHQSVEAATTAAQKAKAHLA